MCVKLLLFLLFVYFVIEVETLKPDNKSVCVVKQTYRATRRRPFTVRVNKWCGNKRCIARRYKTEYYTASRNNTICCEGWQHDGNRDICVPICTTGCNNGRCVAPETCLCDPPLQRDPAHILGCIPAVCTPPCSGAQCWPDNTCRCLPSLQRYNSTHCAHCDEGYTLNSDLQCTPQCDQVCVNSTCVAPNSCQCLEGYKRKDRSTCEPVCDCFNGMCVAPGECSCLGGYEAINTTFCAPICDSCRNGDCIGPQNCTCHDGYAMVDGDCKPVCSKPCVNGVCATPDVCECTEGYLKNESKPEECFKPCTEPCDGTCNLHGSCIKRNCSIPFLYKHVEFIANVPKVTYNIVLGL